VIALLIAVVALLASAPAWWVKGTAGDDVLRRTNPADVIRSIAPAGSATVDALVLSPSRGSDQEQRAERE
jgi:hypothetical protein